MSDDQGSLFGGAVGKQEMKPWQMNATGSQTGRVMNEPAETSVAAAKSFNTRSHRDLAYQALVAVPGGLTSIQIARILPSGRDGNPQNSNRASSRLGELWEEGRATILRERGTCELGLCRPHHKPSTVHRPTAPCDRHGRIVKRGGAAIWVSISERRTP